MHNNSLSVGSRSPSLRRPSLVSSDLLLHPRSMAPVCSLKCLRVQASPPSQRVWTDMMYRSHSRPSLKSSPFLPRRHQSLAISVLPTTGQLLTTARFPRPRRCPRTSPRLPLTPRSRSLLLRPMTSRLVRSSRNHLRSLSPRLLFLVPRTSSSHRSTMSLRLLPRRPLRRPFHSVARSPRVCRAHPRVRVAPPRPRQRRPRAPLPETASVGPGSQGAPVLQARAQVPTASRSCVPTRRDLPRPARTGSPTEARAART